MRNENRKKALSHRSVPIVQAVPLAAKSLVADQVEGEVHSRRFALPFARAPCFVFEMMDQKEIYSERS